LLYVAGLVLGTFPSTKHLTFATGLATMVDVVPLDITAKNYGTFCDVNG
jgi:hypothetical protein